MGYTQQEVEIISRYLSGINSVLDYGSQNLYLSNDSKPPFVDIWYKSKDINDYTCIDLSGDNNSLLLDVSEIINLERQYDLVVDSGFSEHIVQMDGYEKVSFHEGHIHSIYPLKVKNIDFGFYNCWLNKHNNVKMGGLMININPLTNNWINHCYSYMCSDFYKELVKISGYEIIESGEYAACGNNIDGWNLYAVLKKVSDTFPSFEEFNKLPIKRS